MNPTRSHNKISVDFETYSEADLRKVGAWAYSLHPSTTVLCMGYAYGSEDPHVWNPETDPLFTLKPDTKIHAWNSFFEYCIWHNTLKWPALDVQYWHDTAAKALVLALPRALDICGQALMLGDQFRKNKRGHYLIQKLCKPQKGKRLRDSALEAELREYCKQDVIAERKIDSVLPDLTESERLTWELDQRINIRGICIDAPAVENATVILEKEIKRLNKKVEGLTYRAANKVSAHSLKNHILPAYGVFTESLNKEATELLVNDPTLPPTCKALLQIYQLTGRTSNAKYSAMLNTLDIRDNTIHGVLAYHAAGPGRWSGQLVQPQNLPRPHFKNPTDSDHCIEDLFPYEDPELIDLWYGEPINALSSCLRGMIIARPGNELFVFDFASVEGRGLAWQANQRELLHVFRTTGKVYEHTATQIYGGTIDTVTKEQRFVGKVGSLALGYQGGKKAFVGMAATYGIKDFDEDQAEEIKNAWRKSNSDIVEYWYEVQDAAERAIRNKGKVYTVEREYMQIKFKVHKNFLFCQLPSGRRLAYFQPRLRLDKQRRVQIIYSGIDTFTKRWNKHIDTYGGKLVQNFTEGICRDILAAAMHRVEDAGYKTVLTVHDELISERKIGEGSAEEFKELMCVVPAWAEGFPIDAEGFVSHRYRKD